jgi:hypothetical protein
VSRRRLSARQISPAEKLALDSLAQRPVQSALVGCINKQASLEHTPPLLLLPGTLLWQDWCSARTDAVGARPWV